ncbi:hypothetical protein HYPP_01322 [Hyphomicrobium sp. ghe19]|nr:hypothetical protein HYPP_01322 [Hyphomicrobium sp. ghe19]
MKAPTSRELEVAKLEQLSTQTMLRKGRVTEACAIEVANFKNKVKGAIWIHRTDGGSMDSEVTE